LEDQACVIGECRSNPFLDEEWQFTPKEEEQLREIGWSDPGSPERSPNWSFLAVTNFCLRELSCMTALTLAEVFQYRCSDPVQVSFNEVILDDTESARRGNVQL
jgi:hypothetical protein